MEPFLRSKESMDRLLRLGLDPYQEEFTKLRVESERTRRDPLYSSEEALRPCNVPKNRYRDVVPFDYNRVKLKGSSNADGDYINASFVKGPGSCSGYIATQGPLPNTVNDFWSMIWDQGVRIVVMVCQEFEGVPGQVKKQKCFRYWNKNKEETLTFGEITVKLMEESVLFGTSGKVVRRKLQVKRKRRSTTVLHLQYTEWPDQSVPSNPSSVLTLLGYVGACRAEEGGGEPVLIHCSAGCGRTGSMLIIDYVWSLLKSRKISNDFNLFDVVASMRRKRMLIVQSPQQYRFVYGAVEKLFRRKISEIDMTKECKYKVNDIGFPNKISKPRGPRKKPKRPCSIFCAR